MLTRLKVKGFKSLEDVEVHFGPFTCIAGANGVGKSNLFDAIRFLSRLADASFDEAAASVRHDGIASLFTRTVAQRAEVMEFEADLLVGASVVDDFGRHAVPRTTYLTYRLALQYVPATGGAAERFMLLEESLSGIPASETRKRLGFDVTADFLASISAAAEPLAFIGVTAGTPGMLFVAPDASAGQAMDIPTAAATRTVLSHINTVERPTALAARREMQSWLSLQLELSDLRRPDTLHAASHLSDTGAHLPGVLERLQRDEAVANRLSRLLPEAAKVSVEVDEKRKLKTVYMETASGLRYDARSLSDGTLRFLAMAIVAADTQTAAVICLEEPENGIHPSRIPDVVELWAETVSDTGLAISADNPLRQVIINTHAPRVVQQVGPADLLVCESYKRDGASLSLFRPLTDTWRAGLPAGTALAWRAAGLGALQAFLSSDGDDGAAPASASRQAYLRQFDLVAK